MWLMNCTEFMGISSFLCVRRAPTALEESSVSTSNGLSKSGNENMDVLSIEPPPIIEVNIHILIPV